MTSEQLAQLFHETYERLAPEHSYKTRKASAVPWSDVPANNKTLMIAVAGEVLAELKQDELIAIIQEHDSYLHEIAPFSYRDGRRARGLRERTQKALEQAGVFEPLAVGGKE